MSNSGSSDSMEGIAIVGMTGRFPGAKNIDDFWQNLRDGVESITFFPEQELVASGIDPAALKDSSYVRAKGALKDIELFDASFFGFNPREAEITDPQHRIFLECAWEALETAGYDSQSYEGRIGVYAGVGWNSYLFNNLYSKHDSISMGGQQTLIGSDKDFLTTRVSYKLNLTGPSINVQTGCSTSLVATSLACQSLLNYQCDIALAGGVTIYAPSKAGYFYQEGGIFSPDGHCRAFDAKSKGTVLGNGVGIVVLKRLEEALADGDCIYAVIKGSAINNDGSLKVGYTAPSVDGQAEVIAEALALADVEAETIGYIEAHGTGTALGDPIEITALTRAFRTSTEKKGFCAVGSVKTNVGHLDAAAGVTGLIKTALALKHKLIPPSLHFEEPNPQIDFANSPFYVNTTLKEWKANGTPRRAGVSSFGIGGTNAHVILEEAPVVEASGSSRPWQLVLLSAKTPSALETATINLAADLEQHPELNLADVAYTLKVGRRRFEHRRMVVCQNLDDVVKTLDYLEPQRVFTDFQESGDRPVVFMFPGQGAQYVNMALELYQTPIFREQVARCAELLKPHLGLDLRHVLYPREEQTEKATQQLQQTGITQPALFVIEYALAQLWMAWGVRPQAMLGHSIGEYVAACLAGVFSLEEALAVVAARGRLMQQLPSGAMLAVSLPEVQVQSFLNQELSLAAINGPSSCVVSGSKEAIANLQNYLTTIDVACRPLHTSHAFHSQMMNPIIGEFTEQVARLNLKPPQIPFVSNVTGTWITATEATDPSYWARHLRQTVCFSAGVQELLKDSEQVLLEVGPGRTLSTLVKQIPPAPSSPGSAWEREGGEADRVVLSSIRHPRDPQSDVAFLLNTLGRLWMAGVQVDWSGFYAQEQRQRIPLPTYPFERRRYWIEPQKQASDSPKETLPKDERDRNSQSAHHKKPDIADWFYVPSWKQAIRGSREQRTLSREKSCWLVFADTCKLGAQVAKRLELDGEDVITVVPFERFSKLSEREYTINPEQPDDYDALLTELRTLNQVPNAIAHLWSVTTIAQAQSGIEFFEKCQNLGFYSLLFLAQALGKQNISEPIDIVVVTNDIHDVTGVERLSPEKATVLGICKVIPQEYPHITCRSIDVVIPATGTSQENKLIEQLIAELSAPYDSVVAYRGHHRWVQSFEPVRLDGTAGTQLREEGVYLIAGGLGGIGLEIAEYLAQTVRSKLILIGRSAFPKRDEWEQWLATHDEQDEVSQKIQKVQSLEELGAEVLSLSVDVANEAQMQAAIALATERFGQIHGVIYAAGIKLFSTIQEISRTECEKQFRPTVQGLFVLEKVLQGKELDFCLLISSLSSVLGVLGMAAYPATHLFTDAFVHKHNQTNPVPWISANWDNWLTSKLADELTTKPEISTEFFMTAKEGVEVFQRILSLDTVSQIVISTVALQARIEQWIERESSRDTERSNQGNSPSLHSRPDLPNTYVAPRNEVEQIIANIWQELLGIEQVGIHDNFFELGGDSILIIQIITKTKKAGLSLTHTQVFEYPTIAELAEVAGRTQTVLAEQGLVYGVVPLTPIQHWFFEQNLLELHHWNQAIRLEVQQDLDPALLEQVVQQLPVHHDALRLRFVQEESGWKQVHATPDAVVQFSLVDLSALSPKSQEEAFEAGAAQLQATLNLSSGPLVRVALFDLGAHKPSRLLIVIHHLAVDVGSWRILLEDLQTAYQQLSQGKAVKLPPKTTSFKQWSERLIEYAQSAQLQQELNYWLAAPREQVSPLPVNYPGGANTVASARNVSVTLSVEETQALLQEVPAAYRVQIDDVLLAALVQAFAEWTGTQSLLVDLEGRGRDVIFDDVDLSRTVGWFTNIAPVLLDLGEASQPGEALKVVKEQLRSFPTQGLGYGVLRYLSGDTVITEKLRSLQEAEVIFLYLGQLEQTLPESSLFEFSQEFSGPPRSLRGKRSHLLEVTGLVAQGQLRVDWTYSENVHRRDTVEGLAQDFVAALRSLITHCHSPSVENYTPSDFAEFKSSQWSQADLDNIMAAINKSESFEAQ